MTQSLQARLICAAVAAALAVTSGAAVAGGFGVGTVSGSGTGNAYAGGAAVAEDSSVAWSNPAAMTLLAPGTAVSAAGHLIFPSADFRNGGSSGVFAAPGTGEGGEGIGTALIPNLYLTTAITENLRFGLSVNVPFGLGRNLDQGWRGQLTALQSRINTLNINPSLAYKVSDRLSVAAGVSVQHADAVLTAFTGAAATGNLRLEAADTSFGYNFGAMLQATPDTRFGVTYRSRVRYTVEGSVYFTGSNTAGNGFVRADITMPDSASLSAFHVLNNKWELMADLTWTGWSTVKRLDVQRTSGPLSGQVLTTLQFNWKDTLRLGVGANYKYSDRIKLRLGMAVDQTPTNDVDRTPRLPDQDRTWVSFGVQYKPNKQGTVELGYAHQFIKYANINTTPDPAVGRLIGSYDNKVDILTLGYSHRF
ncbi:MAG: OmpP1/FadL family transporter [Betaproteobacteria bacterium]|jgi:long-chain fatty acid transport protein|nr:outer membrane protein transport protein [Betaproteobacteria bacterium]